MIQPHELIESQSVLEYYIEETNEWLPTVMDWQDIRNCVEDNTDFNNWHRAIPLTEKILMEWCGFEKQTDSADGIGDFSWFSYNGLEINNDIGGWFIIDPYRALPAMRFHTLHHLQMLIQSLTNQPLKIELK
jgi:hypothetical protein